MPVFEKLLPEEIVERLPTAVCNPHLKFNEELECLPCYNALTGDVLFKSPTPGARRVSRQKMRALLVDGLDIHWGHALTGLSTSTEDETINLQFNETQTFRAKYVVGADGARSFVRELLLGPEAAQIKGSGFMFATGIAKYNDAANVEALVNAHPVAAIMMGSGPVGGVGGACRACEAFTPGADD